MKTKTYTLTDGQIRQLKIDYVFSPVSNATLSIRQHYPPILLELGINKPSKPRNTILGTTITKRSLNEWLIGVSRYDSMDAGPNEDHYLIDFDTKTLEKFRGADFEKSDTRYVGAHRAPKDYLK